MSEDKEPSKEVEKEQTKGQPEVVSTYIFANGVVSFIAILLRVNQESYTVVSPLQISQDGSGKNISLAIPLWMSLTGDTTFNFSKAYLAMSPTKELADLYLQILKRGSSKTIKESSDSNPTEEGTN